MLERFVCPGSSMRLLFTRHNAIYSVSADGADLSILANASSASGLDYHYERNTVFWTDTETKQVKTVLLLASSVPS